MGWEKDEKDTAARFKGRRQPGSGNTPFAKGDVKTEKYLISNKSTDKNQFPLKRSDWAEIEGQALREGREPLMMVTIAGFKVVVMGVNEFEELIDGNSR